MTQYIVTAQGAEGREFVYRVEGRNESHAACVAYQKHGLLLSQGRVGELLTPWHTVQSL